MHSKLPAILAAGIFLFSASAFAQSSACDLNADGKVDLTDVQLATNMALGQATCTANIYGSAVCNIVVVQRVLNAVLTGTCVTGTTNPHAVTLSWTASTSTVSGYNIYRAAASTGPFTTKLNTVSLVSGTTYTDLSVAAGTTYYYTVRAVDSSGTESANSTVVTAVVPTP